MSHRYFTFPVLALTLLLSTSLQAANPSAVIDQVPSDAKIYMAIPSLSGLSKKIAMLNQNQEINKPQLQDGLAFIKAMTGIMNGVDDQGGMAVVLTDLPVPPQAANDVQAADMEPKWLLMLPVSNYNQFLMNFGIQGAPAGEISQMQMMGMPLFCKSSGKFAIIGQMRDLVAKHKPGGSAAIAKRLGTQGEPILVHADFQIYVDIAAVAKQYRPLLKQSLDQMKQMMQQLGQPGPETEMAVAYLTLYGEMFDAILRDGDAMIEGVGIEETGIGFATVTRFKDGSVLAKDFAKAPAKAPALDRLPTSRPYIAAFTFDASTLPIGRWYKTMVDSFKPESSMGRLLAGSKPLIEQSTGVWQSAWYAPTANAEGASSFGAGVNVMTVKKPAEYLVAQKQYVENLNRIDLGNGMKMLTTYQEKAHEVGATSVDQYTMKFELPEQIDPDQLGPFGAFFRGYSIQTFAGKDVVATVNGEDAALLKAAVGAAQGGGTLGDNPGLATTRAHFPKHRAAEMYLELGELMSMVKGMLGAFGVPGDAVAFPKGLAPLGGALAFQEGAIETRGFVPMSVIVAIKDAVMKVMQPQQNNGGQPPVALTR